MQKLRLGFTVFREQATDAQPHTVEKAAIVTALNLDGTVRLRVFDPDGSDFVIDRAKMVELKDDVGAHYEESLQGRPSEPDHPPFDTSDGEGLKVDKPKQTNPKPEKDRGKGKSPDPDEDDSAPGVKLNPTDRPSTIPGKETIPSVTTPERGAEHAGIK